MHCEIAIEPAVNTEQLCEIRELAHAIWRDHYPGIISSAQIEYMLQQGYSLDALWRDIRQREVRYDRALVGGALAGFSAHGPDFDPKALMLHKLYVDAAFRGRGCARKLIEAASERAKASACSSVVLRVNKRNRVAIDAYERIGFTIEQSVISDIGNGFAMDDYRMRLDV
jgi:ribosomal protein S18 acetylase RimI-like enzyme